MPFPSEFRHNRLTDRWVIVATNRGKRPHQFVATLPDATARDPFDPQNIPADDVVGVIPNDDGTTYSVPSQWKTICLRNAFPYVAPGDAPHERGSRRDGYGYAELVIHSPDQYKNFEDFSTAQTMGILQLYQERYRALAADPRIKHVQIFTNRGSEAGASVIHPHSQIVALPLVPPLVTRLMETAHRHHERHGSSVVEDELVEVAESQERLVEETTQFVAYCPYAPQANYHIRIFPRHHVEHFEQASKKELHDLAELLNRTHRRLRAVLGSAPYNVFVRTAPVGTKDLPGFRWHVDILPHLSTPGGLEASTELLVLTAVPEEAAQALRDATIDR